MSGRYANREYMYPAAVSAGLLCLAFYSYALSLHYYFWEDDFIWLDGGRSLAGMFNPLPNFRPLFRAVFAGSCRSFGGGAFYCHTLMVATHGLVAVLLFRVVYGLLNDWRVGLAASAVFVTTVDHVDAVYWFAAASGPLCLLMFLICLYLWQEFRAGRSPIFCYRASIVFMALAFMAKEEAMTFPVLLFTTDLAFRLGGDKPLWRRLREHLPFGLMLAAYLALHFFLQSSQAYRSASFRPKFNVGFHTVSNEMSAFFYTLMPFKSPLMAPPLLLMACVVAGVVALGFYAAGRSATLWAAGWTVIAFLPMSSYTWDLFPTIDSASVSRYLYVPGVGAAVLMAMVVLGLYDKAVSMYPGSGRVLAVFVCVFFAAAAVRGAYQVREKGMVWEQRSLAVQGEAETVEAFHPALDTPAGFFLDGFCEHSNFEPYMLRYVYGTRAINTYGSRDDLMKDKSLKGRYALRREDDRMVDLATGRSLPVLATTWHE